MSKFTGKAQFSTRLDRDLVEVIDELASAAGRSRNAQLDHMVRGYLSSVMPAFYEIGDPILLDGRGEPVRDELTISMRADMEGVNFMGIERQRAKVDEMIQDLSQCGVVLRLTCRQSHRRRDLGVRRSCSLAARWTRESGVRH